MTLIDAYLKAKTLLKYKKNCIISNNEYLDQINKIRESFGLKRFEDMRNLIGKKFK
jgi:hypothetical protein